MRIYLWLGLLGPAFFATPALAQEVTPTAPSDVIKDVTPDAEDIVTVTGRRQRGMAIGDIEPELTLNEDDIAAYGASTFADLLQALEDETSTGRGRGSGRPIVLLNGVRVANFGEIGRYPSEALQRTEVLSEEAAVQYGFRPDQRVINFILKPGFQSRSVEAEYSTPTQGGGASYGLEAGMLSIGDLRRTSFGGEIGQTGSILESDRQIMDNLGGLPFAAAGNIGAANFGDEIDPALSALIGTITTITGVPAGVDLSGLTLLEFANASVNETNDGAFRSLQHQSNNWSFGASHNRTIFKRVSMTLSGNIKQDESEALLGLASATLLIPDSNPYSVFSQDVTLYRYLPEGFALKRNSESTTAEAALTFTGNMGGWRYTGIADYVYNQSTSLTDRPADLSALQTALTAGDISTNPYSAIDGFASPITDRAETDNNSAGVDVTLNGSLWNMPAGPVTTTVRSTLRRRDFTTMSVRAGLTDQVDLSRTTSMLNGSLDIPLTEGGEDSSIIGKLTLNVRGEIEDYSDVGTLSTLGGSLRWSPVEPLDFTFSYREEDGAPSITQLGSPIVDTPNSRIFDFSVGQTVEVLRRSGGNPDLLDDSRRVLGLGVRYKPFEEMRLTFSSDYTAEEIDNPIASFPSLNPEIDAAFPDRFVRDITGELAFVDTRPVNFQSSRRKELRSGIRFRKSWRSQQSQRPQRPEGAPRAQPKPAAPSDQAKPMPKKPVSGATPAVKTSPPAGTQTRPQASSQARPQARPQGRRSTRMNRGGRFLSASLYHTWHLENEIVIRDGIAPLDLLNGSAVNARGGQSEHVLSSTVYYVNKGSGLVLRGNWSSATTVNGDPLLPQSSGDLLFSDFGTINARAFVSFDQRKGMLKKYPFLKGSRVSLSLQNIFDERLDVRDESGAVPFTYQPDLLDPTGRTLRLSFRKLFY